MTYILFYVPVFQLSPFFFHPSSSASCLLTLPFCFFPPARSTTTTTTHGLAPPPGHKNPPPPPPPFLDQPIRPLQKQRPPNLELLLLLLLLLLLPLPMAWRRRQAIRTPPPPVFGSANSATPKTEALEPCHADPATGKTKKMLRPAMHRTQDSKVNNATSHFLKCDPITRQQKHSAHSQVPPTRSHTLPWHINN